MHIQKRIAQVAGAMLLALILSIGTGESLDFPRLSNILSLSEKASDEMREEDRVSEVLSQDADYRSLFHSVRNPDVALQRFVQPGEELRFQAKWRGLPAGNVRLAAKRLAKLQNRPVFVFELNVESNDFLSALYPVSTSINSYVDAGNGRSYLIRRRVAERKREYKDRLEFKYDYCLPNGISDPVSRYSHVGDNGQEVAAMPFPIPGNMQDMVSVLYYVRGMNLRQVGDSCSLILGGRNKPVLTSITVVGEERLRIPGVGAFDCLVVEPRTDGTNLSGNLVATRGGERAWLERNTLIPVQAIAELPIGSITVTLTQADNCQLNRFIVR